MSEETLSALLDGECSPQELDRLLEQLERSPDLKQAYSRLCLARDAAEGTRIRKGQPCICAGVMTNLDEAPLPVSDRVADLDSRRVRAPLWKPLAGFAVAASIGAAAVLVALPQVRSTGGSAGSGNNFVPQVSSPVSLPIPVSRPRHLQLVSAPAADEEDLSSYLIEHSNAAAGRGMGGTLSYARFAAHNAVYRPQAEEQP